MTSLAAWLPFARSITLVGAPFSSKRKIILKNFFNFLKNLNEIEQELPVPVNINNERVDEQILLNISGHKFKCMRSILNKYPKTLLGSNELDYYFDDKLQEYFFERDPKIFRHILNFYRTGKLHYPKSECLTLYEQELALFGIQTDKISDCCYELHEEKILQNDERIQMELKINNKPKRKLNLTRREALWKAFEDPKSSILSIVLYYVTGFFITISVLANIIETVHLDNKIIGHKFKDIFFVLDTACVLIFTFEFLLRLYSAPNRILFLKSIMSLIDLFSILPYYIMLVMPKNDDWSGGGAFAALKIFRIFRVLKFARHSQSLKVIGLTLKASFSQFGFLLFAFSILVLVFSTLMYYIEKNIADSKFTSIPAIFWYAIVTMTNLG